MLMGRTVIPNQMYQSCSRDAGSDDDSHDWSRATVNDEASGDDVKYKIQDATFVRGKTDATFSINKAHKASKRRAHPSAFMSVRR